MTRRLVQIAPVEPVWRGRHITLACPVMPNAARLRRQVRHGARPSKVYGPGDLKIARGGRDPTAEVAAQI
jgi:hypothetical protein